MHARPRVLSCLQLCEVLVSSRGGLPCAPSQPVPLEAAEGAGSKPGAPSSQLQPQAPGEDKASKTARRQVSVLG